MDRTATVVTEALRQAHTALLADMQKLEEKAVRLASTQSVAELRDRLRATRTHIAAHFRFEEQNGYLDTVRKREPRFDRAIQQLVEEHRQLTQSLDGLIGEAGTATTVDDPLRKKIREWIDHVRQHEIRENDLVQDAFIQDISAED